MRSFGVELLHEGVEAGLLLEAVHARRPGGFLLEGEVHALVAAVPLRLSWLDALDRDAEPEPPDGELGEVEEGVGAGKGMPLSERMACGRPRSWKSCSKAVTARSSRVDSRASQSSRKREAWSVTVSG